MVYLSKADYLYLAFCTKAGSFGNMSHGSPPRQHMCVDICFKLSPLLIASCSTFDLLVGFAELVLTGRVSSFTLQCQQKKAREGDSGSRRPRRGVTTWRSNALHFAQTNITPLLLGQHTETHFQPYWFYIVRIYLEKSRSRCLVFVDCTIKSRPNYVQVQTIN